MLKDKENQSLKEYNSRKKRYKRRRNLIIVTLLLILVVIAVVYLINLYNKSYSDIKVINTTEIQGESAIAYLSYGSSVVKYNKNGVMAFNKDGDVLWNSAYEMVNPIADLCDNYIVIADRGSKSIHIFNQKGEVGRFQSEYNIVKVEVASQGVVAALMQEGDANHIIVYDAEGNELCRAKNTVNNAGYPMDISLSNDGNKLGAVYLSLAEGDAISTVGFYNFSEVGENYDNYFVGGYSYNKGIIIPKVVFLNNDIVCAFKDSGLVIYSVKQLPSVVKKIDFKAKIKSILYNHKYVGVVLEAQEDSSSKLVLYSLEGKVILDKTLDFKYNKIFLTEEEIIMYDDLTCIIMKTNGKEKFRYTFDKDIEEFYPINNLDRYFLINTLRLMDIMLQ